MKSNNSVLQRGKVLDRKGVSSAVLVLGIIVALLIGATVGIYVEKCSLTDGSDDETIDNLTSQIESLESRTNLLENLISDTGDGTPEGWSVDDIYKSVNSSIVQISVVKTTSGLFGPRTTTAQGSGFIIDTEGHLFTNHHVIEDADRILVKFPNGETMEASLVGSDVYSDIGVLKIDPTELEDYPAPLTLGDSSSLEPGDRVIAIGNPFGYARTTTTGVISQVERLLQTESGYGIPGVLQIDAAINPGSSGGPLLSFDGKVIGITTAMPGQTQTFSGIGFAVPSNLIKKVTESLMKNGEYEHPWIGISGSNITHENAQQLGLDRTIGFRVSIIVSDSPASESGLKKNDVLLAIDDRVIMGLEDILSYIVLKKAPGDVVTFEVLRNGERVNVDLELGVRPPF